MGVIYKLTPEVVAFILEEKQKSADLSCRELVALVEKQFGRSVSKSSVHEVLKEANIVSPRGRKSKQKFQIPVDKKAQLIASLPPAIVAAIPNVPVFEETVSMPPKIEYAPLDASFIQENMAIDDEPLKLRVEPMIVDPVPVLPLPEPVKPFAELLPELEQGLDTVDIKTFFLKTAFYDLFPKPWSSVKNLEDLYTIDEATLKKEETYRLLGVTCFKVELEDGSSIFIDARGHVLSGVFCQALRRAPIETAILNMADRLVNNIYPLIIRQVQGDFFEACFYDLLQAMNNVPDKMIKRIVMLSKDGQELTDFAPLPRMRRDFIVGVRVDNKDIAGLVAGDLNAYQIVNTYVCSDPIRYISRSIVLAGSQYRGLVILSQANTPQIAIVSNMKTHVTDDQIVASYIQTYPISSFELRTQERQNLDNNMITAHAAHLFGNIFLEGVEDARPLINVKNSYNSMISVANITISGTYEDLPELESACMILNGLNIRDHQGRKIWARVG